MLDKSKKNDTPDESSDESLGDSVDLTGLHGPGSLDCPLPEDFLKAVGSLEDLLSKLERERLPSSREPEIKNAITLIFIHPSFSLDKADITSDLKEALASLAKTIEDNKLHEFNIFSPVDIFQTKIRDIFFSLQNHKALSPPNHEKCQPESDQDL